MGTTYQIRAHRILKYLISAPKSLARNLGGTSDDEGPIVSCFIAMFGSNTVQSSWANPQQNQQQTQGSAFGQPSAFGSGGKSFTTLFFSHLNHRVQLLVQPTHLVTNPSSQQRIRCLERVTLGLLPLVRLPPHISCAFLALTQHPIVRCVWTK